MLGRTYRYQVYNNTGTSVTFTVKERPWKFGSDGALAYAAAEGAPISAASVGAATYGTSSGTDNSTTLYLGADVTWTATPSASATGTVALYIQRSTDGGTTWPTSGRGQQIGGIAFAASSAAVTDNARVR